MLTRPGTKNIEWNSAEFPTVPASTQVTVKVTMPTMTAAMTANVAEKLSVRRNLPLPNVPLQPPSFIYLLLAMAANL